MAGTKIRGITVELGGDASGLSKALKDVNNDIRDTQKQLKDVERLLKLDPSNMELLRQKNLLLNKSIGETETKLEALKKAEKNVQEQFKKGEVSEEQYNALKREIVSTELKLGDLRTEASKTIKAINGIDEEPIEEVAQAVQKAEKELEEAGKEASSFGDYLKAGAIVEGAKGIVSTLKDISEETKEYQKIMGSLEVSSKEAGYSAEETSEIYKQLYGVLADDQTAATTTANLQALGLSQEKLQKLTNGTIGAWAKYGDSIPIDGLAEAINETVKAGKVTGTFADVLNWAGTSEDGFNEKLEKCKTEAERVNLVMQELAKQGLEESGKAWRDNNKVLVESNETQADLQEQMAELGELVMPFATKITGVAVALLSWFNNLDSGSQTAILALIAIVAAIGPVINGFDTLTKTTLPGLKNAFTSVFGFIAANPIVLLIAAVVAMVALFATKGDEIQSILQKVDDFLQNIFAVDFAKIFGPVLGEALNVFFANVKNMWNSAKLIFDGMIDFIRGVFTGDWRRAWNGVVNIFSGIFSGLKTIAKAPINAVIGLLNSAIGGMNTLIKGANKIPGVNLGTIGKIPYLASGGTLYNGSAVVGEAGPELLTVTGNKAVVQPLTNQTRNNYLGGITMNVYGAAGQDVNELADLVADRIIDVVHQEGAAFA